jgi:hypothetical protein
MSTEPTTASTTSRQAGAVVRDVPRDPPAAATTTTTPTRTARRPPRTTPTSTTTLALLEDRHGDDAIMGDENQHKKRARCLGKETSQGTNKVQQTASKKKTSRGTNKVQQTASKSEDKKTVRTGTRSSRAGQQHGESPFFSLASTTPMTQHSPGRPPLPDSDNDSVQSLSSVDSAAMMLLCN